MRATLVAVAGIALLTPLAPRAATTQDAPAAPGTRGSAAPKGGAAAKPAPSPAAKDLSRALLSSDEWNKLLDRYSSSLSGQLTQSLQAQKEPVPDDLQANLRRELGQKLPYDQAVNAQASALANHFSSDELKQAAKFYASPTGKKVLAELPQALSELGDELQGQLATTVPEIVARVAPKALPGSDSSTGSGAAPGPDGGAPGAGGMAPEETPSAK